MAQLLTPTATAAEESAAAPSAPRSPARIFAWVGFTLFCLIAFTLLKLPEDRLQAYVQGTISAALAEKGISMTVGKTSFSMLFGPSFTLKDVTLSFPPPQPSTHLDEITVSPSLFPLLAGRIAGKAKLYDGDGKLAAKFSLKGSKIDAHLTAKALDVGKLGLAAALSGGVVTGVSAKLGGDADIAGDLNAPTSLNGDAHLQFDKMRMEAQNIMGFAIPKLNISEARIDLVAEKGKVRVQTIRIGHAGLAADDLHATITGEATLAQRFDATSVNVHAQFSVSDPVSKAFPLLDTLLGGGKQSDGSYAYNLTGPLEAPVATPSPGGH